MLYKIKSDIFEVIIGCALLALCGALLCILTYKSIDSQIGYDEAYNLQVVDSLTKGNGYASFGALRGNGPWLFDPHITTGPIILIPLAAVWAITGGSILAVRIFMAAFLWVYVAGLFLLFKKLNHGFILSAFAITASLCILNLPVGKVLGELPAAAVLIFAAILASRDKPVLAALAVGISIQIKLVYGVAGFIILCSFLLYRVFARYEVKVKTIFLSVFFIATPSLLFELLRLHSFHDFNLYFHSIDELRSFIRDQNINNTGTWLKLSQLGTKLINLYQCMPPLAWVATGVATMAVFFTPHIGMAAILPTYFNKIKNGIDNDEVQFNYKINITLALLILAGIAMLSGWITQSNQLSARQGLPFLFLFIPTVSGLGGMCFIFLRRNSERRVSIFGNLLLILFSSLLIYTIVPIIQSRVKIGTNADLEDQIRVVNILKSIKPKSIYADGWWQNPEYQLLAGIPAVPIKTGDSQMLVVQDYQVRILNSNWDVYKNMCSKVVYSSHWNLVCWLPDFDMSLDVTDWGPRNTKVGHTPNVQPDGGAGIWINIKKIDFQLVGPIKVYFSDTPSLGMAYLKNDGEHITASMPAHLFNIPGSYEVTLRQIATGRSFHVGNFIVK